MEMNGRPDGQRPFGHESLLDYYEAQAKEYGKGFRLTSEVADELFREGWQYYHRYLCCFHLGYFEPVIRDTLRNIRLFAFARQHAAKKRDQWRFDQYRPYAVMMNIRARAMLKLQGGDRAGALSVVKEGCDQIESFLREYGRSTVDSECFELDSLRRWHEELKTPEDERDEAMADLLDLSKLKSHLQEAIDREDYEYAALLRDQIRQLEQHDKPAGA
jgi:hypothetical protein